jgi:hypothetical protein
MNAAATKLQKMAPSEIDTQWAALSEETDKCRRQVRACQKDIEKYTRNPHRGQVRVAAPGSPTALEYAQQSLPKLEEALRAAQEQETPYEAEWDRRDGWSRAFRVLNANGHIHNSRSCATCYPTTVFGWLPRMSGASENDIVAFAQDMACTVCFPSAPAHPAYLEGLMETEAAEKKMAAEKCPASGRYAAGRKLTARYVKCPECGATVSITPGGNYRSHKPKNVTRG